MDAPLYSAAKHFEPPARQPRVLDTSTASIAELMALPDIWAFVLKVMPSVGLATMSPMIKPTLGNMSLRDLVMFGGARGDALDRIDEKLRALGDVR